MYDKESIAKEKCKSRLFKGLAGWMTRHVVVFAAVALVMVSAGLATFETKLVYGGNLSYGTDGATSSPTYTGGSGNNPTVHEPGVIGVSVVTYNTSTIGNSGLIYGSGKKNASKVSSTSKINDINDAITAYGENEGSGVWKKQKGYYPYWTRVGYTDKGESIYTYSNVIKHAITQNILSMQTAKSFNKSTLVFVPKSVASSNHLSWIKNLGQHVIGKDNKNTKKYAIFYDLNPWYGDVKHNFVIGNTIYKDSMLKMDYYMPTADAAGKGVYYAKLKAYLKNKEKAKTGKRFLKIKDTETINGYTIAKTYDVTNYARFSELTKADIDGIIGYQKNSKGKYVFTDAGKKKLEKARALYSSMANITEPSKKFYMSVPQTSLIFLRSTTSRTLGYDEYGTAMFSDKGEEEGVQGNSTLKQEHSNMFYMVSENVMRNLFSSDDWLEKQLEKGHRREMTDLKKVVLNNEYNTHYLDMLFCGYALARASGDSEAVEQWRNAITDYGDTAADNSPSNKNVVIRMDTGMVYGTSKDVTYVSTGDVINKHYGLLKAGAYEKEKSVNAKSLNKGFIGFASSKDKTNQNYQAFNLEVANGKGVVTKSGYDKYRDYYGRLEKAINAQDKAVSSGKGWYGTMMAARATYKEYYRPNKNKKATSKVANRLAVVQLLKMRGSTYGVDASVDKSGKATYNYGTYAIDAYAWKNVEQDSVKFNLAIYSTKANKKAPSTNGKNIKDTFQSVTVDVTGDNSTVTDDVYVKLTPDKDKDSKALFAKMLSSNKYYVKVVFEDGTGKTVKTLDGKSSKTVKEIKGGTTSQQKKYAAALNQYDDTNKGSEKGDEQNYNKLVSAKQIGGKDLQTNNCLIWRISNSKVRTDGLKISAKSSKYVNWKAKVYIYKKSGSGASAIWTNVLSGKQVKGKTVKASDMGNGDYTETNSVIAQYIGKESNPEDDKDVNLSGTYESTPEAYAELKEGSVYNETFEAMAGTPSTRSLYFATGGSEFIVNMQAVYDDYNLDEVGGNKNSYRTTRTYKSIFKGVDCEYKKGDQLKSLAAGGSTTETFVSDNQDKKSEKTITVEKNNAVNPTGASSYSTDIKAHNATTKFEATWTGTISNSTPEPKDVGKFKPGKAGSPCAGKGFDKGTQRTKATAETNWSVDAYNNALDQAFSWAKEMEQIGGSPDGTAWRIADSDGYKRIYDVGDAVITVTMSGGSKSNAIECGSSASFSKNGTYTSSQKSSATVKSNDSGVLGSGYSYTKGQFGKGSGYHAGAHGHGGSCPGNDKQTGTDAKGNPIMGPCGDEHNCGSFTPGTDITYGPSATINYTIKVTFKNGTIDAKNYDGNVGESGLNVVKQTGLTQFTAHAMCGACCQHVLPQIEDVWTQKLRFDTIRFTNLKVWKLHSGYVQGMSEIRQTDSGTGTGIEGADGAAEAEEIKKQKEEAEKNEVHIDPDVSTEEGEVIDSDAKYDENGDLIIPDFEIPDTNPDPDDLTEADSDETWDDGSEDSEEIDIVKSKIVRYDPNIFYNIAQADTSKAGRIRYSLQTGQDDTVTWMEFNNKNNEHRTDYCDGQTASHGNSPVKVTANGHKKSWCKGCLYGYHDDATALASGKKNLANRHDNADSKGNAGTVANTKTAYSADKTDKVDKQSFEWKRFDERRKLNCRATVISDFLILQTSSGNESILYYEDTVGTEHNQCQENYKDDLWYSKPTDMNNVKKQNVAKATQMWNDKMWTSNPLVKKVTSLNVGSYNGNYSSTSTKYKGTGGEATVKTAFDKDEIEYNSIMDCKETVNGNRGDTLNKARVTSARRIETEAQQLSDMSTSMQDNNIDPNKCSPGCGNTYGGVNFDTYGSGSARMGKNTASVYAAPTKKKVWGKYSWIDRIDPAINGQASVPEPALFGNAGLVLLQDGIAQCPTNRNKEYVTGQSSAFFIPLITYVNPGADKRADEHDVADYEFKYNDAEDPVLHVIGYTMDSIYTNGQTKVNNIVVHDPVSVKGAAILAVDGSMDQRVLGTDKSGAAEMNKEANSETCPGTAQECQYRLLNCQFGKQIRKAAFSINNARRNKSTDEDTGVTSSYDSIVSDILSDGGSYMDVSLADSGYSIKRYDGKEAFEGVSENDTNQPDRYLYGDGKASLPMTWSAMGADVESTKSDTYELQGVFTFRDNIQTAKALFTTRATKLLALGDGTVQIACADGSVYTSREHALSGSEKNTIQYKFGLDSVMLSPKTIDYKGKSYTIDANTTVTVNGQKLSFVQSTAATSDMSNYIGDGIWIGNQDDVDEENVNAYNTAYACNYNVDNLAVTRLAPEKAENGISYKHTLSCFAAVKTHSKTTQDYYNGVDDNMKVETTVKVDKTFEYTGNIQTITLKPGTYTLEAWGASGGNFHYHNQAAPGKGGYSKGTIKLTKTTTLYIGVGGKGQDDVWHSGGGYNGGGAGAAPGGGATHIATANGTLASLSSNKSSVLLVAGGGAGSSGRCAGGSGGGANQNGTDGGAGCGGLGHGATISAGGAPGNCGTAGTFGKGGSNTCSGGGTDSGSGAGGGYYGGGGGGHDHAAPQSDDSAGGGGSGFASSVLTEVTGKTGEHTGNGLVKISGSSKSTQASIDWTRQKDNGLSKQTGENNVHEHSEDCLSEASKGFQIAVEKASEGDTTDLEKMLGTTVWNQIKNEIKGATNKHTHTNDCYSSSGQLEYLFTGNGGFTSSDYSSYVTGDGQPKRLYSGNNDVTFTKEYNDYFADASCRFSAGCLTCNQTYTNFNLKFDVNGTTKSMTLNEAFNGGYITNLTVTSDHTTYTPHPNINSTFRDGGTSGAGVWAAFTIRFKLNGYKWTGVSVNCSSSTRPGDGVWASVTERTLTCGKEQTTGAGAQEGQVYTYNYTGSVQSVTLPAGKYKLETWGAQGGNDTWTGGSNHTGGYGGYSTGVIDNSNDITLYITVGGKGSNTGTTTNGGYNGGGANSGHGSAGGGATSIATASGQLKDLVNNKNSILLVAGGGGGLDYGGTWSRSRGGDGGSAVSNATPAYGSSSFASQTSGYSFGQGQTVGTQNTGAGGGGYYGGYVGSDQDQYSYGGGGSGYAVPSLTNVSGITGENSGNGVAKITVLEAHTDLDPDKVFALVKQVVGTNYNLIPNTVTTNGITIVNPFWKCKCIFNKHVCDKNCTTDYVLQCKEPHHKTQLEGGKEVVQHYEAGNEICYDACHNDELHKNASGVVNKGEDGKKKAVDFGDFILLDNYFYVYFPNVGDFYDSDSYGIYQTQQNKGKGYQDNFDTTEWTREKWIKFPYSVLYNRNGVWEEHQADEWFQLEIVDTVQNNTVNNECYNLTGLTNKQDTYTYQFYCQLDNEEMSGASVEFAVEAINNQGSPYGSENPYGRDGVFSLDCEEDNSSTMNRDRLSDLTADHSAYKKLFIDVVGRIGNLLFEDTTDVRFSNLFKKNEDGWLIDGIVHKVDKTVQNMYMSWHLNNNDTSVDIRGQKVSSYNEWYNTWNTAKWTDVGDNAGKCVSTPLEAAKNSIKALRSEQMQLGYNLLWDIQTMGSYAGGNVQITPYYYALDTKTDELIPLDVYISNDEDTQLINEFGLMDTYGTDYFETRSKDLFDYAMYLNWNEEKERRNYGNDVNAEGKVTEKSATETASKVLGRVILNADGTPMTRKNPVTGMDEEITAPMTIPMGDDYRLGNVQFLRLDDRAKTFLGNSQVTALHNDIKSVLYPNGSNDQELFHEFDQIGNEIGKNEITEDYYSFRVQRWHATLGLPSSAKFTAVKKDENGKAVHTDPYDLIDGEDGNKIYAYQQFDADYLREHNDSSRYLILETASITAYGAIYDLQYSQGANNGRVSTVVDGKVKTYDFVDIADKDPSVKEKGIPINTLFAVYGMTNSGRDYETLQTH